MLRHNHFPNASLVHLPENSEKAVTIAHTIASADTWFQQQLGRMFSQSIDKDYALLFPFQTKQPLRFHMRFVPYDLGTIYLTDNQIVNLEIMEGWTGTSSATADTVIETHPSLLQQLEVGDYLYLQGDHTIPNLEEPYFAPDEPWFEP